MKLSLIVPVYNEAPTIATVLQQLLKLPFIDEVVVVNDGSTDDTARILKRIAKQTTQKKRRRPRLLLLSQTNQGKGAAVRAGLAKVTGDYVLIQDADLEYDPHDIPNLLKPVKEGKATVVYGSRFLGPHTNLLFWHMMGNQFLNFLTNVLYNTTLSDLETCYKLLPAQLMRDLQLTARDFKLEPEITCKVLKRGIRIFETPISYSGRDFTQGKKITWKDGFGALEVILRQRFEP